MLDRFGGKIDCDCEDAMGRRGRVSTHNYGFDLFLVFSCIG